MIASNQETLRTIHRAIDQLASHQGIGSRWSATGAVTQAFIKDMAEAEASMAYARGVLATVASYFVQDPPLFAKVLNKVNVQDFAVWADANDEPSMTHTELQTLRRFLETVS